MSFKKYLPVFEWLPDYTKIDFRFDLVAGLTVGVMLVPQGMAYALLAGMPPIYGLYASIVPLFLYAILGTSRQLSIGPVAVSAILVLGGISQIAEPESETYISLVILTGLLIGIVQFLMSLFKLGFLVNFLSHPVIAGFTSGAAILIAVSQLKYLFGIDIPRFEHLLETIAYAFSHLEEANIYTFIMGIGSIILMLFLKKINKNIPGALLVAILGILLVSILDLNEIGIAVVGSIPQGLPHFVMPAITWENITTVMPTVLTVTIIGIVESIGIAKALESKHSNYKIRPNQELLALGISKIGGSFFQALPSSGSFTRSAINNETGGRTGISSIITAILIATALLFLTPLFYFLPEAVLAAIVILAVRSLFEYKEAINLWKNHRTDFWMMLITFIVTLGVGIEQGVLAGVVLSVLAMTYKSSKPHISVLGKLPGNKHFRNIDRFPDAVQFEDVLMVRFDAQLYFTNANFFRDSLTQLALDKGEKLKIIILDASSIYEIDSSGLHALEELRQFLKSKNIEFFLCGAIGPVRDLLFKTKMMKKIGAGNQFMSLHDAFEFYQQESDKLDNFWTKDAIQNNISDEN